MPDCDHQWIYSENILCSYPPQVRRICSRCLTEECIPCHAPSPAAVSYETLKTIKDCTERNRGEYSSD